MNKLKLLSEVIDISTKMGKERIEEDVFDNCIIDKGLYLNIYYNENGKYAEENEEVGKPGGGTIYVHIDEEVEYHSFIDMIGEEVKCWVSNDELTIRIMDGKEDVTEFSEVSKLMKLDKTKVENLDLEDSYYSPYEDYEQYNGQKFTVIRACTIEDGVERESGKSYIIKLENGTEVQAFREEICKQGYKEAYLKENKGRRAIGVIITGDNIGGINPNNV